MSPRPIPAARALRLRWLAAVTALAGAVVSAPVLAADTPYVPPPPRRAAAPDIRAELATARTQIQAQDWAAAVATLQGAERKTTANADLYNLLGYATRKGGDVTGGMAHYATALRLDPNHQGALEYQGEGFLQQGQVERAQANLERLRQVCGGTACEAYQDLAAAIAAHKSGQAPAAGPKPAYRR